jgi:putative ABC transport system ATP-binding protein
VDDGGRADVLLAQLHLDRLASRRPPEVSRGEQQRAAVARALLLNPPLLLADEPTAHQDHERGALVLGAIRAAASAGAACLVTSHDPATLDYADRVIQMSDGRVTGVSAE